MSQTKKEIWGLCLIGGKSSRMGKDKAAIEYNGLPQWRYCEELLNTVCTKVFWSTNQAQAKRLDLPFDRCIFDQTKDQGPAAGLAAAFDFNSQVAWFVLACDYPGAQKEDLLQLASAHTNSFDATSYFDSEGKGPEPLFAIWDLKAQAHLLPSPRSSLSLVRCQLLHRSRPLKNQNYREIPL